MAAGLRGYQGYAANLGGHPQHPFATGKTTALSSIGGVGDA